MMQKESEDNKVLCQLKYLRMVYRKLIKVIEVIFSSRQWCFGPLVP